MKYIDFGNVEPLPWSQMHAAPQVFAELPIHAIKCGLSGELINWLISYGSLQYDMWWMHRHNTQSTLLLSDHSIPSDVVLNTYKLCHPANFISFCECIYTVHSTQSTLLLSGQSISSTVDFNDKLSQPAQWYYLVNAFLSTQSTLLLFDHSISSMVVLIDS